MSSVPSARGSASARFQSRNEAAAMFRPDFIMTRTSLAQGSLFAGGEEGSSRYQTHNQAAFAAPPSLDNLRTPRTIGHKNTSQLQNYGSSASGQYSTTNGDNFGGASGVPLVATPRFSAASYRSTDVFGIADQPRDNVIVESNAAYMMGSTASARRKPQPRYVHGGGHRNKSSIPVGQNLVNEHTRPQDFTTTTHALHQYNRHSTPRPTHQFNLPQKNLSTFMSTNLGVPVPPKMPDERTGVGVRVGVREFTTRTDHAKGSREHYGGPADRGASHYVTANASQFTEPSVKLVVPPGKGGVDMTRSTGMQYIVPLGKVSDTTIESNYAATFRGMQNPDGVRPTFPDRGTFGMQVRRKW